MEACPLAPVNNSSRNHDLQARKSEQGNPIMNRAKGFNMRMKADA